MTDGRGSKENSKSNLYTLYLKMVLVAESGYSDCAASSSHSREAPLSGTYKYHRKEALGCGSDEGLDLTEMSNSKPWAGYPSSSH